MTSTTGMQRERHSGELDLFGLYLNEVGRLVGCGNLRMAGELPVRRTHAWYGASRPPHCGEPVHAVEARLPHPVPLHPTARAPGPREPRQVPRPRLEPADRALLAAISRALPQSRWSCFLVKPETLLRWHRL